MMILDMLSIIFTQILRKLTYKNEREVHKHE